MQNVVGPTLVAMATKFGLGAGSGLSYVSVGLNSAEVYDPRLNEWRYIASMSTRRSSVGVGVVTGLLTLCLLL